MPRNVQNIPQKDHLSNIILYGRWFFQTKDTICEKTLKCAGHILRGSEPVLKN